MRIISLRIFIAVLGLSVLWLVVPFARSADDSDWLAKAQREREQAQKEREEWYKQQEQAQKDRDDWQKQQDWLAQAQRDREQAQRDRDEWQKQQDWLAQAQRDREDLAKWAAEQGRLRQEEMNQVQPAARPAAVPPNRPLAADQPKTHTMTIYNSDQVTRVTFVMRDGSWHVSGRSETPSHR